MSYVEIYSLLSANYQMDHIGKMPLSFGCKVIFHELEKREERKAWEMWLTLYPKMTKENFMPFSEFFKMQKQTISKRPKEDILDEVERIRASIRDKEKSAKYEASI